MMPAIDPESLSPYGVGNGPIDCVRARPETLWYYEYRNMLGKWCPATSPDEPETVKRGGLKCLKRVSGSGRPVRGIHEIHPGHQHLSIKALRQVYSPDGRFQSCRG